MSPHQTHRHENRARSNHADESTHDVQRGDSSESISGLVSIVIPCYQQAHFLPDAISSILRQTYPDIEIIVVDDGSTDHTRDVALSHPGIRYIAQKNAGVSSARNTGFRMSRGEYIVFLDADDRLIADAIEIGTRSLAEHPACALTFGTFFMIDAEGTRHNPSYPLNAVTYGYKELLEENAIGNPGVALYRRWALSVVGGFDHRNGPAGDYDLYLRIARLFPVACHRRPVIEYRRHGGNMSNDPGVMLKACLSALNKQRAFIKNQPDLTLAMRRGRIGWKLYYGEPLVSKVQDEFSNRNWKEGLRGLLQLAIWYPERFLTGLSRKATKLKNRMR